MPPKPVSAALRPAVAAPAALKPASSIEAKKSTSKVDVAPPSRPAPQATVKIAPASAAASPAPAMKSAAPAEVSSGDATPDSLTGILAIAATVATLAAVGIQVWMFL
jgi:hypothetical protein